MFIVFPRPPSECPGNLIILTNNLFILILLLSGASAPGSVAAGLEVSVEVGSVDQRVDAAAERGRQEHEVGHEGAHLAIRYEPKLFSLPLH